jgi:hypothetical protein
MSLPDNHENDPTFFLRSFPCEVFYVLESLHLQSHHPFSQALSNTPCLKKCLMKINRTYRKRHNIRIIKAFLKKKKKKKKSNNNNNNNNNSKIDHTDRRYRQVLKWTDVKKSRALVSEGSRCIYKIREGKKLRLLLLLVTTRAKRQIVM